jgi:hypothetical protein
MTMLQSNTQARPLKCSDRRELEQKNSRAWEGKFLLHTTNVEEGEEESRFRAQSGLEFILGHFSKPLFPRNIMRGGTRRGQFDVDGKDRAIFEYHAALWEDCRVSAFGLNQTNPDLIFIELDASNFASMRALKAALTATLKNIEKKLAGAHPTVNWSGRGYHVVQPIRCPQPLEEIHNKELTTLEPETSRSSCSLLKDTCP